MNSFLLFGLLCCLLFLSNASPITYVANPEDGRLYRVKRFGGFGYPGFGGFGYPGFGSSYGSSYGLSSSYNIGGYNSGYYGGFGKR
ncbi:hypothetical protein TELCIR_01977 [Teladorsagia circumcincta]|uniref:Neuropeptide-like protein 31 family protein n=1 Tax=Teladorsagia circumcincta TaxID=45464 RepID=A0A2G9V0G6_TELCI|nr:hypothetical protein TELCIR_01977 [Teladorsagia circumcincta]